MGNQKLPAILNLYSGLGGNRKYWKSCKVTAVEKDERIAAFYKSQFPDDTVIIGDAPEYLLKNCRQFDFVWASPPCPTHSQYRHNVGVIGKGYEPTLPDMTLYQIIIFLKHSCSGGYAVENVKPYYKYLIEPDFFLQRHPFWSNVQIDTEKIPAFQDDLIRYKNKISDFTDLFDIRKTDIRDKRETLRNCVSPEIGEFILNRWLETRDSAPVPNAFQSPSQPDLSFPGFC